MQYSIIQKSQLEGALRLDAEYYQPEYLELFHKINKFKSKRLGIIADILRGNTPKEYGNYGISIIRSGDLSNFFVNEDLLKAKKENIFYLKNNDILISSIGFGSIGKVNIFTGEDNKLGTVSEVTVIRNSNINPFYIWAFLRSNFGQFQINREITGATGQLHLNTGNVENILVPLIDNTTVFEKIYREAEKLYRDSKSFYSQAENLLLEELGMKNFEIDDDLSYTVNLSDIKSAHRADAEYFQPKYKRLISNLKSQNAKLLKDLVSRIKTKIKPKPEEIYKYIEISDINIGNGDAGFNKIIGKELPANARIPIKGGELLISKVRPTRGAIAILPEDFNKDFICSGAFSVFKSPEILKEYLFVVLCSIVGKLQFEKPTTGTSYPTITDEDIENTLVPILPKPTQQKIADLVQKSYQARKKAKELLEQAKRKVEELIK